MYGRREAKGRRDGWKRRRREVENWKLAETAMQFHIGRNFKEISL
jgi:hypothetical protein